MNLNTYLSDNSISVAAFANTIKVRRETVYSWINGKKIPLKETMEKIVKATNGNVKPNDFFNMPTIATKGQAHKLNNKTT